MRVAVLGLGEAGGIYAADFAERGAWVAGVDPAPRGTPPGVQRIVRIADAVATADLVVSLVGASSGEFVVDRALPAMDAGGIFVDMNTAAPQYKIAMAERAAGRGIRFADAAILAPVPRARIETELLLCGDGAHDAKALLDTLGAPSSIVGAEAGLAAGLKLLRSVFMKGMAAVVMESLEAAEAAGAGEWVMGQIAAELDGMEAASIPRMIEGTRTHAVRRDLEMRDARDYLQKLGAAHAMTDATIRTLQGIVARGVPDIE